jgi:hypothetical protein
MLTVPEQYAGQLMKCPLCNGTFTVPALPQPVGNSSVGRPPEPSPVAAGPANPASDFQAAPTLLGSGPAAAPAGSPAAPPDVYTLAPPSPAPPPPPEPPRLASKPAADKPSSAPGPLPAPPPPSAPGEYARTFTIWLSPRVVPWIVPGALLLVVLLLFAPWVQTQVSERVWFYQTGWGTGFGTWWGFAGTLYILLLLLATILAALAVTRTVMPLQFPPAVERVWPYRWVIVSGAVLFAFLLLLVELFAGFGLEAAVERGPEPAKAESKPAEGSLEAALQGPKEAEIARLTVHRTVWLRLAVFFHLVALAGVGLQYALEQRGSRPIPRIDVRW